MIATNFEDAATRLMFAAKKHTGKDPELQMAMSNLLAVIQGVPTIKINGIKLSPIDGKKEDQAEAMRVLAQVLSAYLTPKKV